MASELLYLGLLFTITITCVNCEGSTNESEVILVPAPYRIIVLDQKAPLLINCSVNITGSIQLYNYAWRKDGKLIEENRRKARVRDAERKKLKDLPRANSQFSIFPNGSLYLPNGFLSLHGVKNTTKNRKLDGVYECIVNTSKGVTLARRVKVVSASISQTFHVQPVSTEAYKGGVTRFECKISSEPSTTYIWHKDDKEAHDPRYTVLPSGVLQISDVQQTDEGTYWCQAASQPFTVQENAGYSWKQSKRANLKVKSSTENRLDILAAPQNTAVVVGETAFIECLVDGYPKPKITWRKIQSKMQPMLKPEIIQNFTSQQFYGPGNLRLVDVTSDHAGLYECTITPAQGEPIKRTAILDVLEPPKVEQGPESYSAPVSKSQHLFCKVSGNPTPVITWYHNGTNVDDNLTMFPKDFNSQRNNLVLYFQQIAHSGYYVCVAENSVGQYIGSAFGNVYLTSAAAAQPVNVKIFPLNSTTVNVTWQQPGASDIKTYVVNYQVVELSRPNQQQLCPGQTQYCVLHGLMPFTNYSVSIAAFTSSGSSLVTKMQYVKTPEDVPLAALSITISSPKPNSMLVSWTPLTLSQSRGIVTGYKVYYRKKDRDGEFPDDVAADQTSYLIANLEPSVTYEVLVLAATKAGFPKSDQQAWTSFTMPPVDGAPGSTENSDGSESRGFKISAYNVTANSVALEWQPDISHAGYEICYHIFDQDKSTETCLESKNNFIVITDLESFTKYLFRVQPLNFDDDIYSEIYVKTKEAMSSPPLNVTVELNNARTVMLTWLPPAEPHGDVTFYHILYSKEISEPAQMSWKTITEKIAEDKKVQSASVADLEPGTYFFKVAAVNAAGEGLHSDNQSVVIKCYDTVHFCAPPTLNTEAPPDISSVQQKSSVAFIVGIVVGIFLLALLIFMSVYCWKRRSASRELDPNSNHAPIYRGNGHISSLSNHQSGQKPGNGHAHITQGNGSGDFGHDNSHSPESTPMLQKLSENEQSDSKGPPGLIIQNGLRSNGIIKTNHKSPGQIVISRSGDPNSCISSEELQLLMVTTSPVPTAGSHSMEMVPMSTLDDIDRIDEEQGDHSSEDSGTGCRRAGMPCGEHHLSGSSPASSPGGNSLHRQRTWENGRQGDEFGGVFIDSSTGAAIKLLGDSIEEKKKAGEGCYDDDSANDRDSGHGSEVKSHIGIQSSENHSLSPKTGTSLKTSVPELSESKDLSSTGRREDRISHNPSAVLVASTQSVSPPPSQQLPHLSSRNLFNSNRPHNGHRQHQRGVRQHSDLPPPPPPPHLSSQTLPHHQNLQAAGPGSATTTAEAINTSSSIEEGGENLSNGLGSILFRQLEGKTAVAFSPPRPPPSPPNIA